MGGEGEGWEGGYVVFRRKKRMYFAYRRLIDVWFEICSTQDFIMK